MQHYDDIPVHDKVIHLLVLGKVLRQVVPQPVRGRQQHALTLRGQLDKRYVRVAADDLAVVVKLEQQITHAGAEIEHSLGRHSAVAQRHRVSVQKEWAWTLICVTRRGLGVEFTRTKRL